jgi:hypothetical protein
MYPPRFQYKSAEIAISIRFYTVFCVVERRFAREAVLAATDLGNSVAQRLAGLQSVRDALLRLLLAAQGNEGFAFEVQKVLFADCLR